ncbi:hypothetical protein [Pseudorhodoferax sp.]
MLDPMPATTRPTQRPAKPSGRATLIRKTHPQNGSSLVGTPASAFRTLD